MNDLMRQEGLTERAQRIRDLVGTARTCIIEIGRELISASEEVPKGQWSSWLEMEFAWSDDTARRFMLVAGSFQSRTLRSGDGPLTIEATALYAMAAPAVPQSVRDAALERAEAGETITKEDAEAMIRSAEAQFQAAADKALRLEREAQQKRINAATERATQELRGDKKSLEAEIERIKASERRPDVTTIAEDIRVALGIKKLSDAQWRTLAQTLGKRIEVGRKGFDPVSAEELAANVERLRVASVVTQALEALAAAPPVDAMRDAVWTVQRKQHRHIIGPVRQWINAYHDDLERSDTDG